MNQIIENEDNHLKKCIYTNEVSKILDKYYINIDELDNNNYQKILDWDFKVKMRPMVQPQVKKGL